MYRLGILRQKLAKSDLLKHNLIFFVGTMGIAVFNYLYYPVVSRLVSVPDFGEIQAVISIFMQLGIVLTAFGYLITHIVSNARNHRESNELIRHLEQLMLIMGVLTLPVLLFVSYLFRDSFKLHSIIPVVFVGILILINIPATSRSYILQGLKRLKEVSIGGIVYAVGKLVLTVGLIYAMTDNVVAAVLGYILAQLLMLWYLQVNLKGEHVSLRETLSFSGLRRLEGYQRSLIRSELIYGFIITIILSALTLLYSSDTILARLFFDPHTLGVYSGISSVARIVYFVTASVAGVLVASVKINAELVDNRQILARSVAIIGVIGGCVVAAFAAFPNSIVELLVGKNYVAGAPWLPALAMVMFICSINNLLAIYQIALRRYKTVFSVAAGVVVLAAGLVLFHATIEQFIAVLFVSNLLVCVLLFIEIALEKEKGEYNGETASVSRTAEL